VNGKTLAALLMLPMMMTFAIPVATHATSSNTYGLEVTCNGTASAKLTFLGHTVSITCTGSDPSPSFVEFQSQLSGLFSASAVAGSNTHTAKGFFGPFSCFAEGQQYDATHSSWARWLIYDSNCG
jgi:hypothetical protein